MNSAMNSAMVPAGVKWFKYYCRLYDDGAFPVDPKLLDQFYNNANSRFHKEAKDYGHENTSKVAARMREVGYTLLEAVAQLAFHLQHENPGQMPPGDFQHRLKKHYGIEFKLVDEAGEPLEAKPKHIHPGGFYHREFSWAFMKVGEGDSVKL